MKSVQEAREKLSRKDLPAFLREAQVASGSNKLADTISANAGGEATQVASEAALREAAEASRDLGGRTRKPQFDAGPEMTWDPNRITNEPPVSKSAGYEQELDDLPTPTADSKSGYGPLAKTIFGSTVVGAGLGEAAKQYQKGKQYAAQSTDQEFEPDREPIYPTPDGKPLPDKQEKATEEKPKESESAAAPNLRGRLDAAMAAWEKRAAALEKKGIDTSDIDADIAAAKEEYKSAKKANEWKEVAQMIAGGLAKMGAAMAGGKDFAVADRLDMPDIDYGKRTDSAAREYEMMTGQAEKQRAARRQTLRDSIDNEKEVLRALQGKTDIERRIIEQQAVSDREADRIARWNAARTDKLDAQQAVTQRRQAEQEAKNTEQERRAIMKAATGKEPVKALGILAQEAGMSAEEVKEKANEGVDWYTVGKEPQRVSNLLKAIKEKLAERRGGGAPALSAEDSEALDWASKNPADPRAAEIRKRLGQ
jgi:hypothetical protein